MRSFLSVLALMPFTLSAGQFDFDGRGPSIKDSRLELLVSQNGLFDGSELRVIVVLLNRGPDSILVNGLMPPDMLRVELTDGCGHTLHYRGEETAVARPLRIVGNRIGSRVSGPPSVDLRDGHVYGFALRFSLTRRASVVRVRAVYSARGEHGRWKGRIVSPVVKILSIVKGG